MTIDELQLSQPWTVPYRKGFNNFANHAVLHAMKTTGKLAAVFEACDHGQYMDTQAIKDLSADLVTAAMRLANLYGFTLENEILRRREEKNR